MSLSKDSEKAVLYVLMDGWIGKKKRKNISCGKIVGEVANVSASNVEKWEAQLQADAIQDYEKKDIFNADSDVLFYEMTPDHMLKFKEEKCINELLEVRIAVLVCANINGSEKQKLTVLNPVSKFPSVHLKNWGVLKR